MQKSRYVHVNRTTGINIGSAECDQYLYQVPNPQPLVANNMEYNQLH